MIGMAGRLVRTVVFNVSSRAVADCVGHSPRPRTIRSRSISACSRQASPTWSVDVHR